MGGGTPSGATWPRHRGSERSIGERRNADSLLTTGCLASNFQSSKIFPGATAPGPPAPKRCAFCRGWGLRLGSRPHPRRRGPLTRGGRLGARAVHHPGVQDMDTILLAPVAPRVKVRWRTWTGPPPLGASEVGAVPLRGDNAPTFLPAPLPSVGPTNKEQELWVQFGAHKFIHLIVECSFFR